MENNSSVIPVTRSYLEHWSYFYHDWFISDLSAGRYIKQPNRKCNRLCVGKRCCDPLADCSCGIHTGKYECVCPEGYYGNGLKGGCQGKLSKFILFCPKRISSLC